MKSSREHLGKTFTEVISEIVTVLQSVTSTSSVWYGNQQRDLSWDAETHLSAPWHREGCESKP